MRPLDIGIAFELRSDFAVPPEAPIDALEEYDTQSTIDALVEVLIGLGHRPRLLGGGRGLVEIVLSRPPDLVFNLAEGWGTRSRESHVPAVCEMLGVPYTHSDPLTLALTLDKALTKRVVESAGVATPRFAVVESTEQAAALALPWPLFVKPAAEGSSMGVRVTSRVADGEALVSEVRRCLAAYRQPVLVERYLPGVEVTVGVRGSADRARVIGSMEIAPADGAAEDFVYGLESKRDYQRLVRYHAPPRSISAAQMADAETTALAAYRILGCRDIARVDVRFDETGRANFLEVNPLPGLNPVTGDLVVMTRLLGGRYEDVIDAIVDEAIRRHPHLQRPAAEGDVERVS
jgi:D-alanine-D-alanine ligase